MGSISICIYKLIRKYRGEVQDEFVIISADTVVAIAIVILQSFNWHILSEHRKIARVSFFHNVIHGTSVKDIPPHFLQAKRSTRHHHPFYFITPSTSTTAYQNSYFSRTIHD